MKGFDVLHFAQIENGFVVNLILVDDQNVTGSFPGSEVAGQHFITQCGLDGFFLQFSPTGEFRNKSASIGDTYDADLDEFVSPVAVEPDEPADE
jgi:hypothetical protein